MRITKRGTASNHDPAGSQWSPRQVFVLISVMVLAFALYPVGARAAQVVSAIITDPAGTNQAIVDPGGNLHITSGDDPGRMAYQNLRHTAFVAGDVDASLSFAVPGGKRLVITHVSGAVLLLPGQRLVQVGLGASGGGFVNHFFVPTLTGTDFDGFPRFAFSQDTLIYADGPDFTMYLTRSDDGGLGGVNVAVSGYLIDCTVGPCK